MTDGLVDFLLARIAEDEAWAERVRRGHDFGWQPNSYATRDPNILCVNPARVLAECEAKRRVVARYVDAMAAGYDGEGHLMTCGADLGDEVLCDLAASYADHPDYREEWRA